MKLYNAIERLEEIALAYGNELKSIQAAFPKLQIDMQQALAVRTAELNAEGRMLSSQEIVRQCAAMRNELEAIVGRHFSAVIAERQRMIELTEIKGALTEIAASAASDAVKAYAADETTGVSAIVRREFAAVVPTSPQPATPNWADVFKGNWSESTTYQRGDIFTFRGGCYLVLQTALGLMPSKQNQTGPDAHYGILSAPGAPGVNQPFTSPVMVGSTSGAAGAAGLVPEPAAGTQTKFLRGDGTFVAISGGGDMLAANNLGDVASVSSSRTNLGLGTGDSPSFAAVTLTSAGQVLLSAGATTSNRYANIGNTGGAMFIGVESSAGATMFSGGTAYSTNFGSQNATPTILGTNAIARIVIAATGETSVKSTTAASSSSVGAFTVGDGGGSTTVAIGNGDVNVGGKIIVAPQTPASAAAAGTAGTIAWDASYIYVCVAANTWKRVAIATW